MTNSAGTDLGNLNSKNAALLEKLRQLEIELHAN
jgi:hypothetical protein